VSESVRRRWRAWSLGLMLLPATLFAQDRQITGRVTRSSGGTAVADAEVTVVGNTRYAPVRTNAEGRFTLRAPTGDIRIQVRAIGFTRREIAVGASESNVDAVLEQDVFKLSEVVVTGQATAVERRSATTAIAYVTGEEIAKVAAPTFENALTGKVTGVNLQSNSGAPGGCIQMQIRGNTTILGAADPLYVIDGVIYSNVRVPSRRFNATAGVNQNEDDAVNRVADINPADIQSIEILKGAAASSIYGAKASNGVVVISTLRGQQGRARVNLSQRFGTFDLAKGYDARCWSLADAVARYGPTANDFAVNGALPCYDHYDQVYGNNPLSYETVADVSGGNESTRYFISGTWKKDGGIEGNTGFGRQAIRVNLDQIISPKFDVKVSTVFNRSTHERGWSNNSNNFAAAGYALPYTPSYIDLRPDANGVFPRPVGNGAPDANPLQTDALALNKENAYRFTGGATLNWNAMASERSSLRFVAAAGADMFEQKNRLHTPNDLYFEAPQNLPGTAIDANGVSQYFNWNLNSIWNWRPGSLNSTLSFGVQYEDRDLRVSSVTTNNLVPGQGNVNQGTSFIVTDSLAEERTLALYAQEEMRLLDEKLLIQGGVRAERSSVNGDNGKYYVFPKASASYRFDNLVGSGSEVKLRAAYGVTGNQPVFGQKYTLVNTPQVGGRNGFTVAGQAGSPIVEPEELREVEGGVDASFAGGRIVFEGTLYYRTTENLLLTRVPAPSSGFTGQIFNGGRIQNKGIELGLGITPIQSRDMTWVSRATFTANRSLVLDLPVPPFRPPQSGFGGLGVTFIQEGQPLTQLVGFDYDEAGEVTATQVKIGDTAPDFRMGFSNDFTWGSFNLSFVLDWQQGGSIVNLTQYLYDDAQSAIDAGSEAYNIRRQAQVDGVMTPYIEDATFLKVREVSVGMGIPQKWLNSIGLGLSSARISLSGRNLLTFQKYSGLDPEVANFGSAAIRGNLDIAPFPPSRSVFLNISLGW
jgi:TonB-linked SusC/RagA family outer membrane protein